MINLQEKTMIQAFDIMEHLYSVTNQMKDYGVIQDVCKIVDSYEPPKFVEITDSENDVGGINLEIYHHNIDIIC